MSSKEIQRALTLENVKSKVISLKQASALLSISYPQAKRLWAKYKIEGAKGLASKKRGKKSNRAIPLERRQQIEKIISEYYKGFAPLFISEKLEEAHDIKYSSEFIRQLMIEYHLWTPKKSKKSIHQRRERRECEGELVQIDASNHKWFEERGAKCHLHLLIDDASSTIYGAYFAKEETTEAYFQTCLPYFSSRGLPINLYADKRGTFKVNQGGKEGAETQFSRAMKELDVKIIFAHSPQAKGRIERVFGTLQERLVWEMRIAGISTIKEANKFLPNFIENFNKRFRVEPANTFNAHRKLKQNQSLKYTLCKKEQCKVTQNLEIQYNKITYQLNPPEHLREALKRAMIVAITTLDNELIFQYQGIMIEYQIFDDLPYKPNQVTEEERLKNWKERVKHNPGKGHPWKRHKLNPKTMERC